MRTLLRIVTVLSFLWSALAAASAQALPIAPTWLIGGGTVSVSGGVMTIDQDASFAAATVAAAHVGAGETLRVTQPSGGTLVLIVVGGGGALDPTTIAGSIVADGRVVLVNPSGIVLGGTASIRAGGLVLAGLGLSPDDLQSAVGTGRFTLETVAGSASVRVSAGASITTTGGVSIVGPDVEADGVVTGNGVALAATDAATAGFGPGLDVADLDPGRTVELTGVLRSVTSSGVGGRVELVGGVVRNTGTVTADGAKGGGDVSVRAVVLDSPGGTLSASATSDGNGGRVVVGADASLRGPTRITADATRGHRPGRVFVAGYTEVVADGEVVPVIRAGRGAAAATAAGRGSGLVLTGIDLTGLTSPGPSVGTRARVSRLQVETSAGTLRTAASDTTCSFHPRGLQSTVGLGSASVGGVALPTRPSGSTVRLPGGDVLHLGERTTRVAGGVRTLTVTGIRIDHTGAEPDTVLLRSVCEAGLQARHPRPRLVGTPRVGKVMRVKPGRHDTGARLTYHWYRGSRLLHHTRATKRLVAADRGKRLSVVVTASKPGHLTVERRTAKSAPVRRR